MKNLIFLVARLVCLASLATSTSPYGDTDVGLGEAYNIVRFVRSAGASVIKLTSYNNDTAWTNALAESKVLIFPEGTDGRDISSDTRQAIINWVSEGGVVVFCMGETTLARILTALELRPLEAKRALSGVWAKSEAAPHRPSSAADQPK
ncbi:uncharacterized protein ACA1_109460 [Acanthamoeba castellanii str. Neff]|uniref:Uncharacterized protein n=1 Tax=Acanthamoeba castellanii (strain ATCC 30010 / Neff) TaxID=1257118 RepID=L8HBT5_ACACF|nr:uncharacterized protein ACA1_109460 [Acanthamoeba castellanii str. Neff]ELR22702.1 hypothetical protein ACA1_109460 [Acanthamoeba castellanii str. Neff]